MLTRKSAVSTNYPKNMLLLKPSSITVAVFQFPEVEGLEDVSAKMAKIKAETLFSALLKGPRETYGRTCLKTRQALSHKSTAFSFGISSKRGRTWDVDLSAFFHNLNNPSVATEGFSTFSSTKNFRQNRAAS